MFAGLAEPLHRDALSLARGRCSDRPGSSRGHRDDRRRCRDGAPASGFPHPRRAVPPRGGPHRVRPRPAGELPRACRLTQPASAVRAGAPRFRRRRPDRRRRATRARRRRGRRARHAVSSRSRARSMPRRCRNDPSNRACRERTSPASAPRVAHRRRSGQCPHAGARAVQTSAPTSINASSRSRPCSPRPIRTLAASAARSDSSDPFTRWTTRRTLTSTAGTSTSSAWARIAAAV